MKLSERDKWLALLLPAIVVLAGYGMFFVRGKLKEVAAAEKALADTLAKAPRLEQLAAQRRELGMAAQQTRAVQLKLEAVQQKWCYATGFCSMGPPRNERVERLTSLLNKHDLQPLEDAEVDAGAKETKLSPATDSLAKRLTELAPAQKPQLRRIRFHGRYLDVLHALEELASGEVLAIPIGLTMKRTTDTHRREWTLLVWI